MEIEKEGLHTYRVSDSVQNEYFLSVEYHTIRYNHPDTLLPVLLREQDGMIKLLYELSDTKSLEEISEENNSHGNNFSKVDCRMLLQSLRQLLKDLDELLLAPEHINFSPGCIYRTGENGFRWMYCPDERHDLEKEVQQFFSWMLSEINYGDSEAVRYIYHIYWMIRNKKFSEKLIEDCLNYEEDVPRSTPYESFFAEEIAQKSKKDESGPSEKERTMNPGKNINPEKRMNPEKNINPEKRMNPGKRETKGKRLPFIVEIIMGVSAAASAIMVTALGIYLMRSGNVPLYDRYWIAGVLLAVLLVEGTYQIHCRRKAAVPDRGEQIAETALFFQEGEGDEDTVRLDMGMKRKQPVLKEEATGELIPVQSYPFYIGNDKGLNQLTIYDNTVSRKHAVIERGDMAGIYILKDLQSTNGTWVNHTRIENDQVQLKDGDVLRFAGHTYRFEITDGFV